jgi:peroxiredoxin
MAKSEQLKPAYTDEKGYYRLDSLPFTVEVELTIDHSDYGHSRFWYVPTNQAQDFVLVKADGYLAGKVVDVDGNPVEKASIHIDRDSGSEASGHVNVGDRTNVDGRFDLKNLLVNETESVYVGKDKLYKIFQDVRMNQDDVVFVLEESTEPPKPPTPEEVAGREYSRNTWERSEKMPGTAAPELDVAQWLNGEPAMKGKIVVLHFWLSQDVRSLESIRLINVLQREYGDKGLVCVGIHEATENIDELKKLMEEKGIEYPVAVDKQSPVAAAGSTLDRYAVFRFPTFMVINKEGMIHTQAIGSGRGLEEKVRELVMD